jgi:hypothetical protein
MTIATRKMLPMLAFAIATSLSMAGGIARAEDAMKPAADAMKADGGMMKADDKMMADCKEKAGMEADQMKKDEAMKACDAMGMKADAMGSDTMKSDNAMKPASN